MSEEQQRKESISVNLEIFDQVKQLYTTKTKQELLKITNLSLLALNKLIRKIENFCKGEPTFEALFKKAGRKMKYKDFLHIKIRDENKLSLGLQEKIRKQNFNCSILKRNS